MEREIFMVELNSARIIREARQTKPYFVMTYAEYNFVVSNPNLSSNEKIIWTTIAGQSSPDNDYSFILTQGQIAGLVGMSISVVRKAISKLRNNGFLRTESILGGLLKYFLTLPQAGLEEILVTPNRKISGVSPSKNSYPSLENEVPPVQNELPPRPNRTTPPSKMNDLYNIYNINNNKHNHNLNAPSEIPATPLIEPNSNPEADVLDADALLCEYKNLQEKYQHLPMPKRLRAARSHFSAVQLRIIDECLLALAAIEGGQNIQAAEVQAAQFTQKLAEATPVPESRLQPKNCKLVEFEFENEHYLVEDAIKDKILNEIPRLYQQKQIKGDAAKKPIKTLLKEILYYVAKAGSKVLDACQLQRFHIAKKLCKNGAWERPNGLERQASVQREQKWQQAKIEENRAAKAVTKFLIENVA
jgi:hypothetical protein